MGLFEFICVDCGVKDQCITSSADHVILCQECGGLMLRLDDIRALVAPAQKDRQEVAPCTT